MKTVRGNLIDMFINSEFDVIIHGCNCLRTMGAGIAREIAIKIPEAKLADDMYDRFYNEYDKLSNFSFATVRRKDNTIGIVINLYTQYYPGKELNHNALYLGFTKLKYALDKNKGYRIGIPEIGCGIAGGDWNLIGPKIDEIMSEFDLTHVEFISRTEQVINKIENNERIKIKED